MLKNLKKPLRKIMMKKSTTNQIKGELDRITGEQQRAQAAQHPQQTNLRHI